MTETAEKGAVGGDHELDESFATMFDDMQQRLTKLNTHDRARALKRLSEKFLPGEDKLPPPLASPHPQVNTQVSQVHTFVHEAKKLKTFSGRAKTHPGEIDYKHWRRAARRLLEDPDVSEPQCKRLILQSLTHEADDTVDLHRDLNPTDLLELLDKVYGSTIDGGDLLAGFYQKFQGKTQRVNS